MKPDKSILGLLWEESEDEGRLGAVRVEVLELGRARSQVLPMGDIFADVGGFLLEIMKTVIDLLATVIGTPLDLVAQGASFVIDKVSWAFQQIPGVGDFIAQILTVGKVIINAGLHLPENLLRAFSNLLGSFTKLPEKDQKAMTEKAVGQVMQFAKGAGKEKEVGEFIRENPPTVSGQPVGDAQAGGGTPQLATAAVGIGVPALLTVGAALIA